MKKLLTPFVLGAAACSLLAFSAAAQTTPTPSQSSKSSSSANRMTADNSFATKAAQGGMAEVQLANLAKDHASSADVKSFAQTMVDDHTKANDELKQIASKAGITLPTSLTSKDQATYDRLSKLNGAAFDRAYMRDMVSDHRTDVAEFQKEANSGTEADLKSFASKTLPTLQHHLEMAQTTEGKIKSEK